MVERNNGMTDGQPDGIAQTAANSGHAARELAQVRVMLASGAMTRRQARRTAQSIRAKDADGFYDGQISG